MKIFNFDEYDKKSVLEYKTQGALNENKKGTEPVNNDKVEDNEKVAALNGEVVKVNDYNEFEGKRAEDNPSEGAFSIKAPDDKDKLAFTDKKVWNKNLKRLWLRIKAKKNFFVQGEAGWAKTAIITQMAKKAGFTVITVYLDKAVPEDLAGLPALKDDPKHPGHVVEVRALPLWAQYMLDHKNTKFLLFFDEMNQATNEVMNALMPICLDHVIAHVPFNNFFVGAAGNMNYENNGLESIPRPLMARLGGRPITWITGTTDAWSDAFDYLHKEYDALLTKPLVNAFEKHCTIFASPRDIELNIFKLLIDYKDAFAEDDDMDFDRSDLETIKDAIAAQTNTLEGVQFGMKEGNEYTSKIDTIVDELANKCYNFLNKNANSETRSFDNDDNPENKTAEDQFDNSKIQKMISIIVRGEFPVNDPKYPNVKTMPITHETIFDFFPSLNKTMLQAIDAQMKRENKKWRYPTNADALATGKWTEDMFV